MKAKFVWCVLALFIMSLAVNANPAKEDDSGDLRYDIECAGAGTEGTYLVKVWAYTKKPKISSDQLKKKAVHGVLFKGFAGKSGCTSQKPLSTTPQSANAEYFKEFFADKGDYLKYATIVSTGPEVVKIGKKDYKVGMTITVIKDQLRKDLEKAGVIKGLASGF
jgi:hypothetical protein